ncbi:MAG: ATP-binding protein [Planctomycetes bacterium]|nr:ATP-binding protein [Planctomycetota bacterium]
MPTARAHRFEARLEEKLADGLVRPIPDGTPRFVRAPHGLPNKATAVIGMRRAGKTMFLHQLRRERAAAGVPREHLPYLNFEDEQLVGIRAQDLGSLVDAYYRRFPDLRRKQTITWCFDEIQLVDGWERFVRRLLDEERVEVFLSGSSAAMLSREIATAMRGRAWEVVVHPFSLREALAAAARQAPKPPLDAVSRSQLEHAFLQWLSVGGFPEAQGLSIEVRERLLRDYVDVAMMRDVVERHAVSNVLVLRRLVRHLLGNPGGLFSVEKFHSAAKSQGIAVGREAIHHMLAHLEDCFLVRTLWVDADSERRRMVNPRKVYPIDMGLIPVFDATGREQTSRALEVAVLLELERRGRSVHYVRTKNGHEVDFVARSNSGTELIQVCVDARDEATASRELRALVEAKADYPNARALLLVGTRAHAPKHAPADVDVLPAPEWLLET